MPISKQDFKEHITRKFYSNKKDFIVRLQMPNGGGVIGTIKPELEEPIDFDEDYMVISIANDVKETIPLNGSEYEVSTDEDNEDTFIVRNGGCIYILSFGSENE